MPPGFQITQQDPSKVVIDCDDRKDDPFDLRILPYWSGNGSLQQHKKNLLDNDPYEFIIDETEGYAAWLRSTHPHPMADHKVEVYREVMLGDRKFVACASISDFRADKQLVERVWKAAKSLRSK